MNELILVEWNLDSKEFEYELLRRLSCLEYSQRGVLKHCETWNGLLKSKLNIPYFSLDDLGKIKIIIYPYLRGKITGNTRKRYIFIAHNIITKNKTISSVQRKIFTDEELKKYEN